MVRARWVTLGLLSILILWFLYLERTILAPFVWAGIVAYLFNPLIDFFSKKTRLSRSFVIALVYIGIIAIVIVLSVFLTRRIIAESSELTIAVRNVIKTTKFQADSLPDWLSPVVSEYLLSFEKIKLLPQDNIYSLFPAAITRIFNLIIFLFSTFYFLKEGRTIVDKCLHFIPKEYRIDVEVLIRKINSVLNGYLRGQLFMVFLVSLILFVALSVLDVRYALVLAVFSGFAEIVPIIGPIVAGGAAVLVILIADTTFNFSLNQAQAALVVAIIYFALRQIQDYFITPHVMGRITNLHPLLILFSVLAGGHLFGILGLILAVPTAASIRIIFEYLLDKLAST